MTARSFNFRNSLAKALPAGLAAGFFAGFVTYNEINLEARIKNPPLLSIQDGNLAKDTLQPGTTGKIVQLGFNYTRLGNPDASWIFDIAGHSITIPKGVEFPNSMVTMFVAPDGRAMVCDSQPDINISTFHLPPKLHRQYEDFVATPGKSVDAVLESTNENVAPSRPIARVRFTSGKVVGETAPCNDWPKGNLGYTSGTSHNLSGDWGSLGLN